MSRKVVTLLMVVSLGLLAAGLSYAHADGIPNARACGSGTMVMTNPPVGTRAAVKFAVWEAMDGRPAGGHTRVALIGPDGHTRTGEGFDLPASFVNVEGNRVAIGAYDLAIDTYFYGVYVDCGAPGRESDVVWTAWASSVDELEQWVDAMYAGERMWTLESGNFVVLD